MNDIMEVFIAGGGITLIIAIGWQFVSAWRNLNRSVKDGADARVRLETELVADIAALKAEAKDNIAKIERLSREIERLKGVLEEKEREIEKLRDSLMAAREEAALMRGNYEAVTRLFETIISRMRIVEVPPSDGGNNPQ